MTSEPGLCVAVAPRFHLPGTLAERLRIGAGGLWRPLSEEELARLTGEADGPALLLFGLPGHLRAAWWKLLEEGAAALGQGTLPGMPGFVAVVAEFLAYKGLPMPAGAHCDAVVSLPGQRKAGPGAWGMINLGDEPTALVLAGPVPLRVELRPGEGCRLPEGGTAIVGHLEGKQEPDVMLVVRSCG